MKKWSTVLLLISLVSLLFIGNALPDADRARIIDWNVDKYGNMRALVSYNISGRGAVITLYAYSGSNRVEVDSTSKSGPRQATEEFSGICGDNCDKPFVSILRWR